MEIIIGKTAGFCPGVKRTVEEAKKFVQEYGDIDCLGELVHNRQVVEKLEANGLKVIENIDEARKRVIFRAHGVLKQVYEKANEMHLEVFDLTCPKVIRIHKMAEEYAKEGYYIFLIGEKNHPETLGSFSFCGENSGMIENEEDIEEQIGKLYESKIKDVVILSQTTFNLEKFEKLCEQIQEKIGKECSLTIENTICNATRCRQQETKEIASKVDYMIVIGGEKSSNTQKLYEISKKYCKKAIMIQTVEQLTEIEGNLVGVMAGASTPQDSIEDVKKYLMSL